jgi:hypothetical protein
VVILSYQGMAKLMSPDLYKTWKKQIANESKKVGKAVKKLPEVLPEKEE